MVPADEGVHASSREDGHSRNTGQRYCRCRRMEARCEGRAKDRRGDDLEQA